MRETIEKDMREALERFGPPPPSRDAYAWALFPTGKLFRAKLVWALGLEEGGITRDRRLLAVALEVHHAYTLAHDDLPSMDDDHQRRGRPSTHRQFNEWTAILTGDGLLNLSYRLLGEIDHPRARVLLKVFSHCLGPKGLILGQYGDLSLKAPPGMEEILSIHELKTARMIQCALVGSYLLGEEITYRQCLRLAKLGRSLGIVFQLLDDLDEWIQGPLKAHERVVNPWSHGRKACLAQGKKHLKALGTFLAGRNHLARVVGEHLDRSLRTIEKEAGEDAAMAVSSLEGALRASGAVP